MTNNILYIVGAAVELSNILLCYALVLQVPISKKKQKIFVAYAGIILCNMINIFCGLRVQPAVVNILCCLLALLFVMDSKKGKWILLYPCAFMLSSIMNVAVSFLVAIFLRVSQAQVAGNIAWTLIANSFFTVLMIVIYLIKRIKRKQRGITLIFNNSIYVATTIGAIAFYLLIGLVQYIGSLYKIPALQVNLLGFFLSAVGIVCFVSFLWLSVTIYKNQAFQHEKNMLSLYLLEQEKYIQLILEKDKEMRRFRHDVREHMNIISQCIEQRDYTAAKIYIDKMNEKFSGAQMKRYTGIIPIDAIISEKKSRMDGKGIQFICEINTMRLPEHIEVYDVCTLLINVLNNAIEACEYLKAEDKVIKLAVEADGGKLYIFEKNRFHNEIRFDNDRNPVTTKKDSINHGLGSKNVRGIVEKYGGEIEYSADNNNFVVEIIV